MPFAKSCKGSFALAAWLVPPQLYAKAEKRSLYQIEEEGALTILRSFEIASYGKLRIIIYGTA